jgi:Zn-dependent M28 family amino/carboxypeptidase
MTMKRALLVLAAGLGLLVAALAAWGSQNVDEEPSDTAGNRAEAVTPAALERAVTPDGLVSHLRELQLIANENGGTRESGSPGYDDSVDYVVRTLREADYRPTVHRFEVALSRDVRRPVLRRLSPPARAYRPQRDFLTLEYSGSGDLVAETAPVDVESETSGCEPSDFDDFPPGAIALMRRGSCFLFEKARNAEAAGATAALLFNEGGPGRERALFATLVEPGSEIPVLGLSNDLGEELARASLDTGLRLHVAAQVDNSEREIANVLADLPGREEGGVVLLGAHLDSVGVGPGINDNGSGVATVLETAVQLRRLRARPERGIRFAFWAAEELGLLGSKAYAERLGPDAREELALVLNFDMLGSRNSARLVYAGDRQIERAFSSWFKEHELSWRDVELEDRSDHAPFAALGIPVGGLFSGADELKTATEARLFGGQTGEPHDACYHQECDTLANVDPQALSRMADAAASVALELAGP